MASVRHPWFRPELLVGTVIRGYRLGRLLGWGGFGAVYQTETPQDEPRVLKVLYPPHSSEPGEQRSWARRANRFLREFVAVAPFNHSNIIRIFDYGLFFWQYRPSDGTGQQTAQGSGDYYLPFYVAEYLPEGLDRRRDGSPFPPSEVVKIGRQLCDALEALHRSHPRVLHLDLHPGNIRLAVGDRVVLTDFGVASMEEERPIVDTTVEPPAFHTGVAAPEQITGEKADPRTDIFQLGALLFWMLTGMFPRGVNREALLHQNQVPENLRRLVLRCLEQRPQDRFQDVGVVSRDLRLQSGWLSHLLGWLRRLPGGGWRGPPMRRVAGRPPLWRRPAFWALASPAVVAGAILAWLLLPPEDPTCISVTIANSSAKREFVNQAIQDFNRRSEADGKFRLRGRCIQVEPDLETLSPGIEDHWRSGSMVDAILNGRLKPVIASPADSYWLVKLQQEWKGRDPIYNETKVVDVAVTPDVIAMWQSRAVAIGCWPEPGPRCTWTQLRSVAASPTGWGMVGHPEWGRLKFGYGYVGKSNSGTFTVVHNCLSGLKKETLDLDDVRVDNGCGQAVKDLEKAEISILERSEDAVRLMRERGSGFLDAVSTNEQEVIKANLQYGRILREPMVSVYFQDGFHLGKHPAVVLDGAPWVEPEQEEAAQLFLQFLQSPEQQSQLVQYGLRPAAAEIPLGPPVDLSHGANPEAKLEALAPPGPQLVDTLIKLWEEIRKPPPPIAIEIASSITKREWLDQSVERFNGLSVTQESLQVNGRPVSVEVLLEPDPVDSSKLEHYLSITMVTATLEGTIKPTILSPADEAWLRKLNREWRNRYGTDIVPGKPVGVARTPIVIAMWQSRAVAIGCWPKPQSRCTWAQVRSLATDPTGWGMVGHPEWGKLKFGYAYVGESDVGTHTAHLFCAAGVGKPGPLTLSDVSTDDCRRAIAEIETAKTNSGKSSPGLLKLMQARGPPYLDAVTTYEKEVIASNREFGLKWGEPLVAVYPQDGTVVAEHPFAILEGAEWVSPEQVLAAQVFRDYLLSQERQQALMESGLRPADPAVRLVTPIDESLGVSAAATLVVRDVPQDPLVLERIKEVWNEVKKKAAIVVVFDKSRTMEGAKLSEAKAGVKVFIEAMDGGDWVAWMAFDNQVHPGPRGLKRDMGPELDDAINSITAGGGNALYDAILAAHQSLSDKRSSDGDGWRYGLVVLSNGRDSGSTRITSSALQALLDQMERNNPQGIKIHTIGIGPDSDKVTLANIAASTNGRPWEALRPEDVKKIYRELVKYY